MDRDLFDTEEFNRVYNADLDKLEWAEALMEDLG
jgi:hypothetical protein